MKKIPAIPGIRKLNSFTLVELLVVIAIIAILAATVLKVGSMVINMAKRTKAANEAQQIQTACLGYYTEYSVYPTVGAQTTDFVLSDVSGNKASWGILIDALCGNISASTALPVAQTSVTNSRGIAFLSLKASDVDGGDAPLNAMSTNTATNPYFNIAMDSDYDGVLGATPSTAALPNFTTTSTTPTSGGVCTAGIAVWANCNGKNSINSANSANWYVHTY